MTAMQPPCGRPCRQCPWRRCAAPGFLGPWDAADWLDRERVSARIAKAAGTSHVLAPPVLTYDRDPSRLVWAAEVKAPGGRTERWLVAGASVWRDAGSDEVTGGPPPDS